MKPCTLWYRYNRIEGWEYNHMSSGHERGELPEPKCGQKWLGVWEKKYAWLSNDIVPKVVFYEDEN